MDELSNELAERILGDIDSSGIAEMESRSARFFVNTFVTMRSGQRYIVRWARSDKSERTCWRSVGSQVAVLKHLVRQNIPVPIVYKVDLSGGILGRAYFVMSVVPGDIIGHLLRRGDVKEHELESLAYDAGAYLRQIHMLQFSAPGRITKTGEPTGENICAGAWAGRKDCIDMLSELYDRGDLLKRSLSQLELIVEHFAPLCAAPPEGYRLLHGDYHAYNILADKGEDGLWRISGAIDTEEALSGDIYFDFGVTEHYFLRHHGHVRKHFLEGYGEKIDMARYRFWCFARFLGFDMVGRTAQRRFLSMVNSSEMSTDMAWYELSQ
jgi:aminoglycoside phosphotransferase (APT) family kinase protein